MMDGQDNLGQIAALAARVRVLETELQTARAAVVRYERLRVLGCAPYQSVNLPAGTVLRFTNLDEWIDRDIELYPSRGEAKS